MFLPLAKADEATRTVWARAAAEEVDKAREILDYATAKPAFQAWSDKFHAATLGKSLGNLRSMHNPRHLAGKIQEILYDDGAKTVDVMVKILDPVDWIKVTEGGYTGLSIGGGYAAKWPCPLHKGATRYTPRIAEISLVDSPCIPSAMFLDLQKSDGTLEKIALVGHSKERSDWARTFSEMRPPPTFADLRKGLESDAPMFAAGAAVAARTIARRHTSLAHAAAHLGMAAGLLASAHSQVHEPPPDRTKVAQTMHEWKAGKLRAWRGRTARGKPRTGPKVTDQKQAIAIALSQARRAGLKKGWDQDTAAGAPKPKVGTDSSWSARTFGSHPVRGFIAGALDPSWGAASTALDIAGTSQPIAQHAKYLKGRQRLAAWHKNNPGGAAAPKNPSMPNYMQKFDIANAIDERLEKGVIGAVGRAIGEGYGRAEDAVASRVGAAVDTASQARFRQSPKFLSQRAHAAVQGARNARGVGSPSKTMTAPGQGFKPSKAWNDGRAAGIKMAAREHGAAMAERAKSITRRTLRGGSVAGGLGGTAYALHTANNAVNGLTDNDGPSLKKPRYMKKGDAELFLEQLGEQTFPDAVVPMEKWVIPAAMATGGALAGGFAAALATKNAVLRAGVKAAVASRKAAEHGYTNRPLNAQSIHHQKHALKVGLGAIGLGTAGNVAGGVAGWKYGRTLEGQEPDKANLKKPRYMRKGDAALFADPMNKRTFRESVDRGAARGSRVGLGVGALAGGAVGRAATRSWAGAGAGAVAGGLVGSHVAEPIGALHGALTHRRDERKRVAALASTLSPKEHAQRIAAAKARWLNEGHHDLDHHFDQKHAIASRAILGRDSKVASVEQERDNTWNAVADTHAAYDKVRPHLPHEANLMMEIPHQSGLLYNPEAVGERHFAASGQPKHRLYLLHPAEVDDWIAKHGKDAKAVTKMTPRGQVDDLRDLAGICAYPSGCFVQLAAAS